MALPSAVSLLLFLALTRLHACALADVTAETVILALAGSVEHAKHGFFHVTRVKV